MQPAILSLHDVMPETIGRMEEIIKYLDDHRIPPITLLVVPGRSWRPYQIHRLRELAQNGFELAAHGWLHHVEQPRGLYHRFHSAVLSRNVAEHLAMDGDAIRELMLRAHGWFHQQDLPAPRLYVPPAWALGRVSCESLKDLPFERIEILKGVLDVATGKVLSLPLVGFEADTAVRAGLLNLWNRWQLTRGRWTGRPVRIGLHPHDFHLRLSPSLRQTLTGPFIWQNYHEAVKYVSGTIPSPA